MYLRSATPAYNGIMLYRRWGWVGVTVACAALGLLLWHQGAAAGNALPPDTFADPCSAWTPVNNGAFGMGTGGDSSYKSEEGFEVVVFDGRLYLGMEADNIYGARLWRTKTGVRVPAGQADWEEVAAVNGLPFGNTPVVQNDHIDSLAVFQGALYASTANGGSTTYGTLVYSSSTGNAGSWTRVITAGFGDVHNTNFKDMQVFQGWLCGGTQNWQTGAQVWCTQDGSNWVQKNYGGFGATGNQTSVVEVWSGYVYNDALYFGVQTQTLECNGTVCLPVSTGALYRTTTVTPTQPTWTRVFTGVAHSRRVDILGDLDGYLYIATSSPGGIVIYRSASGGAGTWTQVNQTGMNGNSANSGAVVDGATVYNGALYVAVTNTSTGVEVWRTTGVLQPGGTVDWEQVDGAGLGDPNNDYSELMPFNGYLYAWTSNYVTGQRVYRAACPICQTHLVAGAGRYDFDGVGAVITLTAGAMDAITACVLPGAPPTTQTTGLPLPRVYTLAITPTTATFTADVTLHYTPEELTASGIADETSLYLTRWGGATWNACPAANRARDVAAHAVTCRDVNVFSTWVIAGAGGTPTRVHSLVRWTARGNVGSMLAGLLTGSGWLSIFLSLLWPVSDRATAGSVAAQARSGDRPAHLPGAASDQLSLS